MFNVFCRLYVASLSRLPISSPYVFSIVIIILHSTNLTYFISIWRKVNNNSILFFPSFFFPIKSRNQKNISFFPKKKISIIIAKSYDEQTNTLILPVNVRIRCTYGCLCDVDVGRVSPIYRSTFAIRQIILIHMVQSSSGQAEILQET